MVVRANRKFISMTYAQPRAVVRCGCCSIVLCIVENDRSRLPSDREKFCSRSSISHVGLWPIVLQKLFSRLPTRNIDSRDKPKRAIWIRDAEFADSIIARWQRSKEFCNTIGPIATLPQEFMSAMAPKADKPEPTR